MTDRPAKTGKVLVYRHGLTTRVTHWLNVVALTLLLLSGLQIFNAHPALYWGAKSTFAQPWLSMTAEEQGERTVGVTTLAGHRFETTGLFGYSGRPGMEVPRGFPSWATIPHYRSLVDGRHWHFFFAWVFVVNGLVYLAAAALGGHLRRDLWPSRDQIRLRHVLQEILTHARLKFPKGEEARRYNVLQKAAYLGVVLALLPLMLATGLTMSPGFNAIAPWMLDLFGGRQSARTIHFICAGLIVAFIVLHVAMVALSGVWNNLRSMITGRYAIDVEEPAK